MERARCLYINKHVIKQGSYDVDRKYGGSIGNSDVINTKLNDEAREIENFQELKNHVLSSASKLLDAGYTTVFHPWNGEISVHWGGGIRINVKTEEILQGW